MSEASRSDILRKRQQDHEYEVTRKNKLDFENKVNQATNKLLTEFESYYINTDNNDKKMRSFKSDNIICGNQHEMIERVWELFVECLLKDGWDQKSLELEHKHEDTDDRIYGEGFFYEIKFKIY